MNKLRLDNKQVKEDMAAPANSMGASSSTSGPVQTFDPLLKIKKKIFDRIRKRNAK